jgi:CRISPR/Cas system-associated exonuclease Cas4 (RecB family)
MTTHAPISASKLERIILCPGSYLLEKDLPNPTNAAAQRGTDIHELADMMWNEMAIDYNEFDTEMVQIAIDYVTYLKKASAAARFIFLELDLTPHLSRIHPDLGGTADAVFVIDNALHVVDLKTGRIKVDPNNNKQLMMYALGALMMCIKKDIRVTHIYLHIFQPHNNCPPYYVSFDDMEKFEEELIIIAKMANEPTAPKIAGAKQCKYCRAKAICPSIKDAAVKAAQIDFEKTTKPMHELLDKAELCKVWADAVQDAAKQYLGNGGEIQGWSLQAGRKMTKWNPEFKHDWPAEAYELKTPAAVKKLKIEIPDGAIIETHSAPSLTRIKE